MYESVAWLRIIWLLGHVHGIEVYTLEQPTCCLPLEAMNSMVIRGNERLATRLKHHVLSVPLTFSNWLVL